MTEQERAVGITAFISPDVQGFGCTIKRRYTDFLVNEILPNGEVVHLTNDRVSAKNVKNHVHDQAGGRQSDGSTAGSGTAKADEMDPKPSPKRKSANDQEPSGGDLEPVPKKLRTEANDDGELAVELAVEPNKSSAETAVDSASTSNRDRKEQIITGFPVADRTGLAEIFGEETTAQVLDLYASVILHPGRKPRDHPTVQSESIAEKSRRTEAHVAIRRIFDSKLETATLQDAPGVISIKAAPTKGPSGARGQLNGDGSTGAYQKGKLGWSELGDEYLHFTLYKENKDTMEVLGYMASQLKVASKNFQFAGTKDRRGATAQRVAIYRVRAEQIAKLNKMARGWRVGNFEYKNDGLDLGQLGGNEFLLTLRDCRFQTDDSLTHEQRVQHANEAVATAAESFKARGFLNYYGLQRFGTFSTGTHTIGLHMLKGDLESAIDAILAYSDDLLPENQVPSDTKKVPQDDIDRADAIRIWRTTKSGAQAASKIPRRFQAESAIIQYLGKKDRKTGRFLQDRDWQGALMQIQRNLRLMYVHAYQSFVWNTVAGKRWELFRDRVVEGDLVIVGEKDDKPGPAKDEVDEDGEPIFHPAADDSAPSAEDLFTRARRLSKEEAESGKYDIFDLVLPLPGFDVEYPGNAIGKFYEDFMASDAGGGLDPHNMRRSWKDASLSGGYRKTIARPGEAGYEVKTYTSDDEQMVETDLERLGKAHAPAGGEGVTASTNGNAEPTVVSENKGDDKKVAVVLKMKLGSSQYATMALRELTKGGAFNYKPDYSSR